MKVAIGSDHRGIAQRNSVLTAVETAGCQVVDCGTFSNESCDYPDIAADVAKLVSSGDAGRGILLCGTGIGVSLAANRFKGVLAAVCHDERTIRLSRQHNNANVLCLPADVLSSEDIQRLVAIWLAEPFEGGRHARRVDKILALEKLGER